jgi:NADPH-dependent ferric siderophore reductase
MLTVSRVELKLFPLEFRLLQVLRVTRLTPRMVRVTLGGEGLAGFTTLAPTDHLKVILPHDGEERPVLPTASPQGFIYPEGVTAPRMRDYTPRRFDAATGELDLDFVVHGIGPASDWADQADPGQFIGIAGPRGSHIVAPEFDWYLLVGDETALPSIGRWIEELPAGTRATAIVEVTDAAEKQDIAIVSDVELIWLTRDGAEPGTTNAIEQAVRALSLPACDGYIYVAGEATTLQSIRRHLLTERRTVREWTDVSGHWKRQVADWDHHESIED